jgi:Cyclic nucleotide-binding domain
MAQGLTAPIEQPVMSPDALPSSLEAGTVVRVLAPGELLFQQGDRAAAIYKVESGRLRLIRRTVDDHLVILHTARGASSSPKLLSLPKPTIAMPSPPCNREFESIRRRW